ncbi:hypothetical protein CSB20_04815 [bacterium DOLZORAL124_64_63]|nr:MAG: hypothetical protein CSB20_04815 [bacterium DOLZORAL124_64_63]
MQNPRIIPIVLTGTLAITLLLTATMAGGQSASGSPRDLTFEIVNATDQAPGRVERLQLEYQLGVLQPVFDIEPDGHRFTVPAVPVKDRGHYVVTAWHQGVPYYRSLRGRELLAGPVKLHVFDVITSLDQVAVSGLDLVMRQAGSLLDAEYMLQVENRARPQATVIPDPPLELTLPAAARSATLSYGNGPKPLTRALDIVSGKARLDIPLTTGRNALRVKVQLEFTEGMELPVGAGVPIEAWGLLATPANLAIQGFGLETAGSQGGGSHLRFTGSPLDAGEDYRFRLSTTSASAGQEEDLFTQPAAPSEAPPAQDNRETDGGKGFLFVLPALILVAILAFVALKRRR